jgi:hypothetical protein
MSHNPTFENRLFTLPPAPQVILPEDVLAGDTIRVTSSLAGIRSERTGVAATTGEAIATAEGAFLWSAYWGGEYTIHLIDRPKPKLPDELGAVIFSQMSRVGGPPIAFMLGASGWHRLPTGEVWDAQYIKNWKLAKVVEA